MDLEDRAAIALAIGALLLASWGGGKGDAGPAVTAAHVGEAVDAAEALIAEVERRYGSLPGR